MSYTLPEGSDQFAQKAIRIARVYAGDMEDDQEFGDLVRAIATGLREAWKSGVRAANSSRFPLSVD